jgi:hypothetical protein
MAPDLYWTDRYVSLDLHATALGAGPPIEFRHDDRADFV